MHEAEMFSKICRISEVEFHLRCLPGFSIRLCEEINEKKANIKETSNKLCSKHSNFNAIIINPLYVTGLFLYSLKTSENQRFFDVFRG